MMKSFQANEVIFRPGDPSECAYLIEAGQVEVREGEPGRSVRIALLGKGDMVGEMALIDERPRSVTARAVGPASLSVVSREHAGAAAATGPTALIAAMRTRLKMKHGDKLEVTEA